MTTSPEPTRDVLALIAHDEQKDTLMDFCVRHRDVLAAWDLIGTGTSAERISEATGLPVEGYLSGPKAAMHTLPPTWLRARLPR